VRLVDTGRLCQIIRGQDLQCTWDGCRSSVQTLSPDSDGTWDETPAQGEYVHGVMRADDGSQGRAGSFDTAGGVKQNVFVLIPTVRKFTSLEDPAPPTQH
jgi:RHO1 GDP-GTP exchange protein 1/2